MARRSSGQSKNCLADQRDLQEISSGDAVRPPIIAHFVGKGGLGIVRRTLATVPSPCWDRLPYATSHFNATRSKSVAHAPAPKNLKTPGENMHRTP
jgi:hypothetical protein